MPPMFSRVTTSLRVALLLGIAALSLGTYAYATDAPSNDSYSVSINPGTAYRPWFHDFLDTTKFLDENGKPAYPVNAAKQTNAYGVEKNRDAKGTITKVAGTDNQYDLVFRSTYTHNGSQSFPATINESFVASQGVKIISSSSTPVAGSQEPAGVTIKNYTPEESQAYRESKKIPGVTYGADRIDTSRTTMTMTEGPGVQNTWLNKLGSYFDEIKAAMSPADLAGFESTWGKDFLHKDFIDAYLSPAVYNASQMRKLYPTASIPEPAFPDKWGTFNFTPGSSIDRMYTVRVEVQPGAVASNLSCTGYENGIVSRITQGTDAPGGLVISSTMSGYEPTMYMSNGVVKTALPTTTHTVTQNVTGGTQTITTTHSGTHYSYSAYPSFVQNEQMTYNCFDLSFAVTGVSPGEKITHDTGHQPDPTVATTQLTQPSDATLGSLPVSGGMGNEVTLGQAGPGITNSILDVPTINGTQLPEISESDMPQGTLTPVVNEVEKPTPLQSDSPSQSGSASRSESIGTQRGKNSQQKITPEKPIVVELGEDSPQSASLNNSSSADSSITAASPTKSSHNNTKGLYVAAAGLLTASASCLITGVRKSKKSKVTIDIRPNIYSPPAASTASARDLSQGPLQIIDIEHGRTEQKATVLPHAASIGSARRHILGTDLIRQIKAVLTRHSQKEKERVYVKR